MQVCCTCAAILPEEPSPPTEKALPEDRIVTCCARIICGKCIHNNRRFAEYCPYCQVSNNPSSLPQRLRDPPSYTSVPTTNSTTTELSNPPPPYSPKAGFNTNHSQNEKAEFSEKQAEDTLHFLNHEHDSINSLSLRYGVPAAALRRANGITSDHLLRGRRTVVIPGEYYKGGVSLSPRPVEGEEEELRKNKIRRFMTSCKVSDYDVALLYLEQVHYDIDAAMKKYIEDEVWEREHPQNGGISSRSPGKAKSSRGHFWRGL